MSLSSPGRAQAIYDAVKATNPNFGKLDASEQASLLKNLQAIFGQGDLTYLIANTVVLPSALQAPAGATVQTAGSPSAQTGATTSSVSIVGTGKIS